MRQSYVLHLLATISIVFGYKLQKMADDTQNSVVKVKTNLLEFLPNTTATYGMDTVVTKGRKYNKRNAENVTTTNEERISDNFIDSISAQSNSVSDSNSSVAGWQVVWSSNDKDEVSSVVAVATELVIIQTKPTQSTILPSIIPTNNNFISTTIPLKDGKIISSNLTLNLSDSSSSTTVNISDNIIGANKQTTTEQLKPTSSVVVKQQQSPSPPQLQKVHKTDAPMLNYIFDTHSTVNKHHHHDHRYGPHFEDLSRNGNISNITVQVGSTIFLNCRISLLQDKTVSWVRRKYGEDNLQLLTVGMHTYSGDSRYTVEFQYPNNWRLKIAFANKRDEGVYECQISTYPPRVIQINLHVNAPEVLIIDEQGIPLQDKYYEVASTIQLSCIVRHVTMTSSVVYWSHGDRILNYDTTRGGISVKTDLMEEGANSSLSVGRVNKSDSGNYTCSISTAQMYTVTVHVLNEESLAELHHGGVRPIQPNYYIIILALFLSIIIRNTIWFSSKLIVINKSILIKQRICR